MHAYVSGQAAAAVVVDGLQCRLFRHGESIAGSVVVAERDISRIFSFCTDVQRIDSLNEAAVVKALDGSWRRDRALRLLLLAIDADEEQADRHEAEIALGDLLNKETDAHLVDSMCARPLPAGALNAISEAHSDRPASVATLFARLMELQAGVVRTWQAWGDLPDELFLSPTARDAFCFAAVEAGSFAALAQSKPGSTEANAAILHALLKLKSFDRAREVVSAWTKAMAAPKARKAIDEMVVDDGDEALDEKPFAGNRSAYENARAQIQGVASRMRAGNLEQSRKLANELTKSQLANSGAGYAAKSLCSLAQLAKKLNLYELQLEWALRASEIRTDDPIAHGHAADALIHFSRLDEALAAFKRAEELGQVGFAAGGRARVLRAQGRLPEALEAFQDALRSFPNGDDALHSTMGAAETLREMSRWAEAVTIYDEGIAKFSGKRALRCGRAAVLQDQGRLSDALRAYEGILLSNPNDPVALNGRATVLRHMGRLEESRQVYTAAIQAHPWDAVARCGRAEVLRALDLATDALNEYAEVKRAFPSNPVAFAGYADTLRALGRLDDAIAAFKDAETKFKFEPRIAVGHAFAVRDKGNLSEALRLFDLCNRAFPHNIAALLARADTLKKMDRTGEALTAYNDIIARNSEHRRAKNALAALHVTKGEYDAAEKLLPNAPPETEDDWAAYLIRGMLMHRRATRGALAHLEKGLRTAPYARVRQHLANSIAAIRIGQDKFKEAEIVLKAQPASSRLAAAIVLDFHVAVALNRERRHALAAQLRLHPYPLIKDLAASTGASVSAPRSRVWFSGKLAEVVLLEAA